MLLMVLNLRTRLLFQSLLREASVVLRRHSSRVIHMLIQLIMSAENLDITHSTPIILLRRSVHFLARLLNHLLVILLHGGVNYGV